MKRKNVSIEPKARVMSATDVWEDAQEIALLIKKNLQKSDPKNETK